MDRKLKELQEQVDNLRARGAKWAELAIGREKAVKTGPNQNFRGLIETCEVARVENTGRRLNVVFKITLKSGTHIHGPFYVRQVPGPAGRRG
jgi:hypothetical protein